jgi:hypothetical protein
MVLTCLEHLSNTAQSALLVEETANFKHRTSAGKSTELERNNVIQFFSVLYLTNTFHLCYEWPFLALT